MSFQRIIMGTAMISSVRVLRLLSQFVAVPILSRLLSPAEYGLVAIAMPFALFAMVIADAGIGMSLVRTLTSERKAWSTCFWLSIGMGAVLALIMAAAGRIAAHVFNEPALAAMMFALAFAVLAQATHLIPVASLQQEQRFRAVAIIEILSTLSGLVVAVAMAYNGFGAWSLIGQQLVYFAFKVVLTFAVSSFRPLWVFRWGEVREHVLFGGNVLGANLVLYTSRAFDSWIVGKMLGTMVLGFYSMAFQLARLPQQVVSGPLQFVLYSQLVKMKDNPAAIARVYLVITRLLAILLFPGMGLLAVAYAPIFSFLLSAKWMNAGWVFMLIAPACAVQAVVSISEAVLFSLNRSDVQFRTSAEYSLLWIAVLLAVGHGLNAAAIAYALFSLLYQVRYLRVVLPLIQCRAREYLASYVLPLIATGVGIGVYLLVSPQLPETPFIHALVAGAIALTATAVAAFVQRRHLVDALRGWGTQPQPNPPTEIDAGIPQP